MFQNGRFSAKSSTTPEYMSHFNTSQNTPALAASLHFQNLWLTLPDISLWLLFSAPLHNNTLFHYLVVLDPGLASERHLLEPPSAARGPTPSQCCYPLHNPGLCTELSGCWGGGNIQAFIPWSPSP